MDTVHFFKAWDIYQTHWGRQEQRAIRSNVSAILLQSYFKRSSKMKALCYMHDIVKTMWGMEMFIDEMEVFGSVIDMAEACMGEDYDEEHWLKTDPSTRLCSQIHMPNKKSCLDIYHREWKHIKGLHDKHRQHPAPLLINTTNESIYRVSAIVVLP